jgi:hypothetical protein
MLVKVPTLVIFGCAFVVTVPAVTAEVTLPDTLAPCMLLIVLPSPINCPAVTVEVALINPVVNKLPPAMLAALVMLLVALINPPVNKFPVVVLPDTDKLLIVPRLVKLEYNTLLDKVLPINALA